MRAVLIEHVALMPSTKVSESQLVTRHLAVPLDTDFLGDIAELRVFSTAIENAGARSRTISAVASGAKSNIERRLGK